MDEQNQNASVQNPQSVASGQQVTPLQPVPPANKSGGSKVSLVIIAVVIFLLSAGGTIAAFYLINKEPAENKEEQEGEDEDVGEIEDEQNGQGEEVEDEEADPYEGWLTHSSSTINTTFKYPSGWIVTDNCANNNASGDCDIEVTKDKYTWNLMVDPFLTGGGYGFLLTDLPSTSPTVKTAVTPGGFNVFMVNGYLTTAAANQILQGQVNLPANTEFWDNSVSFRSETSLSDNFGFGKGAMYNDTLGDFFAIKYSYDIQGNYANMRIKGSQELVDKLAVMDLITNSVVFN